MGRIAAIALGIGLAPAYARATAVAATGASGDERRYPIPAADGVQIDRDESVIIARAGGRVFAFSLACPHQNTALRWRDEDRRFQCPKHKSRYEADGKFISGRATRSMDRFAVRRDGADVVVNLDRLWREDEDPEEWSGAALTL